MSLGAGFPIRRPKRGPSGHPQAHDLLTFCKIGSRGSPKTNCHNTNAAGVKRPRGSRAPPSSAASTQNRSREVIRRVGYEVNARVVNLERTKRAREKRISHTSSARTSKAESDMQWDTCSFDLKQATDSDMMLYSQK
ncbi:hypothetical protein L596_018546 [Steinernema carpocapsae]|uniref:Uncharacterized protein n=1 Tax=Steinernema carpocapsae TaxID=34508 RepID=A0A4U5N612_STECR|nr:hypothetical protein L596_018546 [Steinernema carpocapsae]